MFSQLRRFSIAAANLTNETTFKRITNTVNDLMVVNTARVSFSNEHEIFNASKDKRLINYLNKHRHWTPFSHTIFYSKRTMPVTTYLKWTEQTNDCAFYRKKLHMDEKYITFYESGSLHGYLSNTADKAIADYIEEKCPVTFSAYNDNSCLSMAATDISAKSEIISHDEILTNAPHIYHVTYGLYNVPIFVSRQWFKHTKGFTRNEVSRRYVKHEPTFSNITELRAQSESLKQGSLEKNIDTYEIWKDTIETHYQKSVDLYNKLLENKLCSEQARMVLPQAMNTSFIETGTLDAYMRLFNLRCAKDTQKETRLLANKLRDDVYSTFGSNIENRICHSKIF